jgi:hypothetical protein
VHISSGFLSSPALLDYQCPVQAEWARFSAAQAAAGGVAEKPKYTQYERLSGALPATTWIHG